MGVSFEVEIKFAGFGLSLLYRVLMSVDFICLISVNGIVFFH